MHTFHFTLLLCFLTFPRLAAPTPSPKQHTTAPIIARISQSLGKSSAKDLQGKTKPLAEVVEQLVSKQQPDGSWPDIHYLDRTKTNFSPAIHLDRLKLMADAYSSKKSSLFDNQMLYGQLMRGLRYFVDQPIKSDNWWHNEINLPRKYGELLILLQSGPKPCQSELQTQILDRLDTLRNPEDFETGANRIDVALWHLYQALLRNRPDEIKHAVDYSFNSLVITLGEGIQPDGSFHSHGPQLYAYGYGTVLLSTVNRIAKYLKDTPYQMPTKYLDAYRQFVLGAYAKSARGHYVSFSAMGRSISRPNATFRSKGILNDAQRIDPAFAEQYQKELNTFSEAEKTSFPNDFTYFPRSDYATFRRPNFNFTVKFSSTETYKQERGNGENVLNKFLTEGATNILVSGKEYHDLFPIWDWAHIPGTTVPQLDQLASKKAWGSFGTSTFTGGVTDGKNGLAIFAMNDFETCVQKAWFCIDDTIICLGSALNSSADVPIHTTLNQTWLNGSVFYALDDEVHQLTAGNLLEDPSINWVHHDKIGYITPNQAPLVISTQTQQGSWQKINGSQSSQKIEGQVFKLWIDHGLQPQHQNYSYFIVPGKNKTAFEQFLTNDFSNYVIIENSPQIQAVYYQPLDLLQVVYYTAGQLRFNQKTLTAKQPGLIQINDFCGDQPTLFISDPTGQGKILNIELKDEKSGEVQNFRQSLRLSPEKKKTTYQLPRP